MEWRTRVLSPCLAALVVLATLSPRASAQGGAAGFYHVSGREILDPTGKSVVLKGMSFGNTNYGNPAEISEGPVHDHGPESYFELAEMGLDHVRFEFNYGLFEDDEAPYQYKEAGFDWLDQNIAWAKAAGIHLILEMKHPQGGYQASTSNPNSGGKALWIGESADENQKRLIALWTAIAQRYRTESTVIGYGLVNEPVAPQRSTGQETLEQWSGLAQHIADSIREVDSNHILFVECLLTLFDQENYDKTDWDQLSLREKQFLIDDDNVVYEFHFYEPFEFTSQGADWMDQYKDLVNTYPSNTVISADVDWNTWKGTVDSTSSGQSADGWQYFETQPFSAGDLGQGSYNYAHLQVSAANIGVGNSVWFDDITVTRTDSAGNCTALYSYDFLEDIGQFQWGFWAANGGGAAWDGSVGHGGCGSLRVYDTTGQWDNAGADWFYLEPGCTYQISGWVRGEGQRPQADLRYAKEVWTINEEYVRHMLEEYTACGFENDVPMYAGEWGLLQNCYDKGAADYMKDLTTLFQEYGLSSNYHAYHDPDFGLYLQEEWQEREGRNETLYELLTTYYGTVPAGSVIHSAVSDPDGIQVILSSTRSALLVGAVYEGGQMLDASTCPVTAGTQCLLLPLPVPSGAVLKLFLLDEADMSPLCPCLALPIP